MEKNSTANNIIRMLNQKASGTTYVYNDFDDCGNYNSVRSAVVHLCKAGYLARICQGVYIKPNADGSITMPDDIMLACEIDRKNGSLAIPKGDTRAYVEGELKKNPDVLRFYTDGASRTVKLPNGKKVIFVKK